MMPLFHMNAVSVTTMSALYAGGSTVVSPKFSASRFWQIISDYQITSFRISGDDAVDVVEHLSGRRSCWSENGSVAFCDVWLSACARRSVEAF